MATFTGYGRTNYVELNSEAAYAQFDAAASLLGGRSARPVPQSAKRRCGA